MCLLLPLLTWVTHDCMLALPLPLLLKLLVASAMRSLLSPLGPSAGSTSMLLRCGPVQAQETAMISLCKSGLKRATVSGSAHTCQGLPLFQQTSSTHDDMSCSNSSQYWGCCGVVYSGNADDMATQAFQKPRTHC